MLRLPESMRDAITRQARDEHPLECCGVIAARQGSVCPCRLVPMRNSARAEDFFAFEPLEQLRAWREMEAMQEFPLVLYHSHTASRPYPSATDIEYAAAFPEVYHLIVSTDPRFSPAMRCYRIADGQVVEEPLTFE